MPKVTRPEQWFWLKPGPAPLCVRLARTEQDSASWAVERFKEWMDALGLGQRPLG